MDENNEPKLWGMYIMDEDERKCDCCDEVTFCAVITKEGNELVICEECMSQIYNSF